MFFIINININLYIKMIPGYYINLERSKERRNFMEQTYKILTRIEAYDGNKLDKYTDIILPKKVINRIINMLVLFPILKQ